MYIIYFGGNLDKSAPTVNKPPAVIEMFDGQNKTASSNIY